MSGIGAPRNRSKALVTLVTRDGRELIAKDISQAPRWFRVLFARRSLRNEQRVYQRLSGVIGIPGSYGMEGPDRLLLERFDGQPLDRFHPGALPPSVFDALDRLIETIHQRGVAIADLHRSNVLVTADHRVGLVDFAIARIAADPADPSWSVRRLFELDRHAARRIRARYLRLPEPVPVGFFGLCYRLGRRLKRLLK
jgi:RIO-like serine/threonine protein kinase